MKDQKRMGIILSYINTFLNMCISIFFTPFLISSLGDTEYGLYRIVQSFAGQLSIMAFGMSTLVTRNIVYYDCKNNKKEKENFLAMSLLISVILSLLVCLVGYIMFKNSNWIFSNSFTSEEQRIAKRLIALLVINIAVTVLNDYFLGFLTGHEKFVAANGSRTIRLIFRVILLTILLNLGLKSTAIVLTDILLTIANLFFNIFYGIFKLGERIRYYYFNKIMFKESMLFSGAILIQSLINQVNQNLDSFILGVMTNTKTVAIYSVALTIYTSFNGITTAISSVYTPKATKIISSGCDNKELEELVFVPGRYQLMIAGAVVVGFILFGKEFIYLWLGETYFPVYKISLILILPMIIPLVQSVTNSILDAKLKRMSRSIILILISIINVISSVILVKKFGYIGAAYGTAISVIIGHIIIMNIYFQKCIHLNILRIFRKIFYKLLRSIVLAGIISLPLNYLNTDYKLETFLLKMIIYVIIYSVIIYFLGMNDSEKLMFKNIFQKIGGKLWRKK